LSSFIKPLLALVISILLFAGFAWLADNELSEFVQTQFYNPSVFNSYVKENAVDADIVQNHILYLQKKFETILTDPAVRSSFLYNQRAEDIFERSRIFGILLETTNGLQSVQFVDSNGVRIHFSTSARDIISQNINSTAYRNYNEDPLALPYDTVSVASGNDAKFIMDEQTDRIIFSFPFSDSMDVYRGTAIFTVSVRALAEKLVTEGRLNVNENVSVVRDPPGILLGSPHAIGTGSSRTEILENISSIWNEDLQERMPFMATAASRVTFEAQDSGIKFSLISLKTRYGLFFGRLVNDNLFSIPDSMKLLLRLSIFLTIFLTLYFLFNIKPNAVTLVHNRIKRLRESLFEHLYINKSGQERARWVLELEQRREEIRTELKRNLRLGKRLRKNIDAIIDKSWDELLGVLKSGSGYDLPASFKKQLDASAAQDKTTGLPDVQETKKREEALLEEILEEIGEIEEVEDIEDIDEIENIEEIEEVLGIEESEEIEEIEEIEEAEYLEQILDKAITAADAEVIKNMPVQVITRGLLRLAENKLFESKTKKQGLLARAESKIERKTNKGLLARAENKAQTLLKRKTKQGLLARASGLESKPVHKITASEIEFAYDVKPEEQDLIVDIDIVSPFSSMFSSLEED
jgi:hypothetical protein